MTGSETSYEAVVKEFGNGAHITVPKDWIGDIIQLERVGPHEPPLFTAVDEGDEVIIDIEALESERERHGFDDSVITVSGEVIDYSLTTKQKLMSATLSIDAPSGFYRITVERDVGDDGWSESKYKIEKTADTDEMMETDEIISLSGSAVWIPLGEVTEFAVKQSVPA